MYTKRVLITGSKGQLGMSIMKLSPVFKHYDIVPVDLEQLDITSKMAVKDYFNTAKPDFVINCAAYTAVDEAETDEAAAFLVNQTGPKNLAENCLSLNIPLIHISTDYVFSGKSKEPYIESDTTGPLTKYGLSKLAGEEAVIKSGVSGIIIRTSWLYSEFGHNFVKSMIRLGKEKDELGVVSDQYGSPTYAGDLAQTLMLIINKFTSDFNIPNPAGIYHFCNKGICTWYDLAAAVMEEYGISCKIRPIVTEDFPRPAPRPEFSALNTDKIISDFDLDIPAWRASLIKCIEQLKLENQ